jgi:hypothetical protein
MSTRTRAHLPTLTFTFSLAAVPAIAAPTRAQQAPRDTTIDAQLFQPAIGPHNFLTVESPEVPDHKQLSFGLTYNYQRRPYILYTQGTMPETANSSTAR